MKQSKPNQHGHTSLTEQRMQSTIENHNFNSSSSPQSPYRIHKMLACSFTVLALLLLTIGVVKENLRQQEHFYCFKTAFKRTAFPDSLNANNRELMVKTRYHFNIWVDAYQQPVARVIATTGSYEPAVVNLIGQILKEGDFVFVASHHFGLEGIVAGFVVGPKGKVFITEPSRFNRALLERTLEENRLSKITHIYSIQPSNKPGKDIITSQTTSTTQPQNQGLSSSELILVNETIFLDTIDNTLPTEVKLDFAYIDVDDSFNVLVGMKHVIARSQKLVILMKWENRGKSGIVNESEERTIFNLLKQKGYKSYSYQGGSYMQSCSVGEFTLQQHTSTITNTPLLIWLPTGFQLPR